MLTFNNDIIRVGERVGIGCYTTCALSENNNSIGVAPKISNIRIYPLDGSIDVKQAEVFGICAVGELGNIGLTEYVYPIVDRDNRKVIIVAHEVLAIVSWYVTLRRDDFEVSTFLDS